MTTGKAIALTRWTFVDKVTSLLFNMLSRLVITFLPRSKCLLISWLQSQSAVILEPRKIKSAPGVKLRGCLTLLLFQLEEFFKSNIIFSGPPYGFSWKWYAYSKTCPFCFEKVRHQRKTLFAYKCMATFTNEKFMNLAKMKRLLEKCFL